jgi:hypothetical protein
LPDFVIINSETAAFGHVCKTVALIDHRSHRQIFVRDKHLFDFDPRLSLDGGRRRRVRGAQECIGRAERQDCDPPDDDQLPIHDTAALRALTLCAQDLDILIVKVRLIQSIELRLGLLNGSLPNSDNSA